MLPKALRDQLKADQLSPEQQQTVKGGQRVLPHTRSPRLSPRWDEIIIRLQVNNEMTEVYAGGGIGSVKFRPHRP
ncbi:MAG: hypothetical protein KDC54_05325 [Lewinella sp.]|nr:hypothetical protein [Lewinella sp.]